jgi:ubiquinone/menaquinone biosynthesis C-methylase UbiE
MNEHVAYTAFKAELLLKKLCHHTAPLKILEIGCGNGLLAHFIANESASYILHGTDNNPALIEAAQNAYTNVHFHLNTEAVLPLESNTLDIVYFAESLHHMAAVTRKAWLQEAHRLLKPTGRIFIIELNPWHLPTRATFKANPEEAGLTMLSAWQVSALLLQVHFSLKSLTFAAPSVHLPAWWFYQPIYFLQAALR